jgi:chaperone protein EcpD
MRSWKPYFLLFAAVVCGAAAFAAHAAIVITGTRVIYPAQNREVNVRLSNVSEKPVLVQAWLDDGNAAAAPNEIKVPFMLLPAVFRVEPNKGQSLRIMFTGADMPKDRESVYWLNVLEIPSKASDADTRNLLQLAFRTRIKMFYRPETLTDDPTSVREQLKWSLVSSEKGERAVRVENPSPYYVSFGDVSVSFGEKKIDMAPDMAPPFGHVDLFPTKGKLEIKPPLAISYAQLSDYGGLAKGMIHLGENGMEVKKDSVGSHSAPEAARSAAQASVAEKNSAQAGTASANENDALKVDAMSADARGETQKDGAATQK